MNKVDIVNILLTTLSVVMLIYSTYIVRRYRHKEYEVALYQKQLEQADKLLSVCTKFTNEVTDIYLKEYTDFLNRPKTKKQDDFANDILLGFYFTLSLKIGQLAKTAHNNILYTSALLPEPVIDVAIKLVEDSVNLFEGADEPMDIDYVFDFFGERQVNLLIATRESMNIDPLSEATFKKISNVPSLKKMKHD